MLLFHKLFPPGALFPLYLQVVVGNEFKWNLNGASAQMETVTYIRRKGQRPVLHARASTRAHIRSTANSPA